MPGFHLEASGCPISAGRGSKKRKIIGTTSEKRKIIGTRSEKRKMIGKGYVKKRSSVPQNFKVRTFADEQIC